MTAHLTFGICGYSGSGKTTLIEAMLPLLFQQGLKVAVVKHDAHGLNVDREGKDTDRFFKAGADVIIGGPEQSFFRKHGRFDTPLEGLLGRIGAYYDLILVEGHKSTPLDQKVWLSGQENDDPPPDAINIRRVLRWREDRPRIAMSMIADLLPRAWRSTPVYAGILIGGHSGRFGSPKHLVEHENGKTWIETTLAKTGGCGVAEVVLLGTAELPAAAGSLTRLADVPGVKGPLAGMLAAMRWNPSASWIFIPCDLPLLDDGAVPWLLEQRKPGAHAVFPRLPDAPHPEPLLAYYDFRAAPVLETLARPMDLLHWDRVATPLVPDHLRDSWRNVNTRHDLQKLHTAKAKTSPKQSRRRVQG